MAYDCLRPCYISCYRRSEIHGLEWCCKYLLCTENAKNYWRRLSRPLELFIFKHSWLYLNQMLIKFCFVIMVYGNKATSFHCSCKMCFSGQSWFCEGKLFFFLSLWSLNYTKNFLKIAICSWFEKTPGSLCACGGKQ